jgi:hypothetical protein
MGSAIRTPDREERTPDWFVSLSSSNSRNASVASRFYPENYWNRS